MHAIIAFGQHTQSNDVGRGMSSSPLGSTHNRTMSGVACHYRLWTKHTVRRRGAWYDITALGQHTRSSTSGVACLYCHWVAQTVGWRWALHAIIAFGKHTQSNDVGRGMPSSPWGSTQDRTMPGVACHHRLWATHTVRRRGAWHDITALGQHTRSATSSVA